MTEAEACPMCPETKVAAEQCIAVNGEEKCADLVEAHKACMEKLAGM